MDVGTILEGWRTFKNIKDFKFWQDGNHAKEIYGNQFLFEKLDYIHNDPVEEMIVAKPEGY